MTLAGNFKFALIREYVLAAGLRVASRKACVNVLKSGPGNSVVLTVGGAAESLLIEPGRCLRNSDAWLSLWSLRLAAVDARMSKWSLQQRQVWRPCLCRVHDLTQPCHSEVAHACCMQPTVLA